VGGVTVTVTVTVRHSPGAMRSTRQF